MSHFVLIRSTKEAASWGVHYPEWFNFPGIIIQSEEGVSRERIQQIFQAAVQLYSYGDLIRRAEGMIQGDLLHPDPEGFVDVPGINREIQVLTIKRDQWEQRLGDALEGELVHRYCPPFPRRSYRRIPAEAQPEGGAKAGM